MTAVKAAVPKREVLAADSFQAEFGMLGAELTRPLKGYLGESTHRKGEEVRIYRLDHSR
jgi:hypothetical protein